MTRTLRVEWVLVAVLAFGLGFGPIYISARNQTAILTVTCQLAETSHRELEANLVVLEAQKAVAHDLGLPTERRIALAIETLQIPEVPPECETV